MKTSLRFLRAAMMIAALALFGNVVAATAQCSPYTIVNNCTVPITICLWTTPAIPCLTVPAGGSVSGTALVTINGITSTAGINYGWVPNPIPPPPFWVRGVTVGPAPGICVDAFFNPATCTVFIRCPGTAPCRP